MADQLRIALPLDLDWPIKRHHEVYAAIQDYAKGHAPHWLLVPDLFPSKWMTHTDQIPGYDAVIGRITKTIAKAAGRVGIPAVNVWLNSPVRLEVPSVLSDFAEAGRMAGEHLVARGVRRFAAIGYRRDVATREYFQGLKGVAKKHRIPMSRHYCNFNNSTSEKNWHQFVDDANSWIDSWKTPIGIAGSYDALPRYMTMLLQRRGLHVPEDVTLIGANDEFMVCTGSEPTLSSIDMGIYNAGLRAAELLDHLLKGGEAPSEPIRTKPADLVARQSTDVYTVADKTVGRAMRFIADNCNRRIHVADVVNHVGCNRGKLEREFREAGRKAINEEIVALRIELTKRLLVSTDDSTQQVADNAGYGTAQHMRHVFRHQVGMSPTKYRNAHRKQ